MSKITTLHVLELLLSISLVGMLVLLLYVTNFNPFVVALTVLFTVRTLKDIDALLPVEHNRRSTDSR
jgi:hypothetical protein